MTTMPGEQPLIDISFFFRINEEISSQKNPDDLYNSIVKISVELAQSEEASLLLYNKSDGMLYLKSTTAQGEL